MTPTDRYSFLEQLGRGGMGEVWLARETTLGGAERLVVIKRARTNRARSGEFARTLLHEARVAMRLVHPNVAHIHDVGSEGDEYYLVIEYVAGADLRELLDHDAARQLTPELAAFIAARVADALHHVHTLTDLAGKPLGIVHRDINPHNIRIGHNGIVKVLDFGIAKVRDAEDQTLPGVLKGTCAYMSPEQAAGDPEIDRRSDLFSLGIVLHEMLTHRRLFKRPRDAESLAAVLSAKVPAPNALDPAVPARLSQIALRLLARPVEQRYGSAREVQRDLDSYLGRHPAGVRELERLMDELFAGRRARLLPDTPGSAGARNAEPGVLPPNAFDPTVSLLDEGQTGRDDPSPPGAEDAAEVVHASGSSRTRWQLALLLLVALGVGALAWARYSGDGPARQQHLMADSTAQRTAPATPIAAAKGPLPPSAAGANPSLPAAPAADTPHRTRAAPRSPRRATVEPQKRRRKRLADRSQQHTPAAPPTGSQAAPAATATPTGGTGRLTIDAEPWAIVYIDGKPHGPTPLVDIVLSAGSHDVRLRNPDRALSRRLKIQVPRNGTVRKRIQL